LQHVKRAALRDFNARSAEVICEVSAVYYIFQSPIVNVKICAYKNNIVFIFLSLIQD